jgi:hypothetical protein
LQTGIVFVTIAYNKNIAGLDILVPSRASLVQSKDKEDRLDSAYPWNMLGPSEKKGLIV